MTKLCQKSFLFQEKLTFLKLSELKTRNQNTLKRSEVWKNIPAIKEKSD